MTNPDFYICEYTFKNAYYVKCRIDWKYRNT